MGEAVGAGDGCVAVVVGLGMRFAVLYTHWKGVFVVAGYNVFEQLVAVPTRRKVAADGIHVCCKTELAFRPSWSHLEPHSSRRHVL